MGATIICLLCGVGQAYSKFQSCKETLDAHNVPHVLMDDVAHVWIEAPRRSSKFYGKGIVESLLLDTKGIGE